MSDPRYIRHDYRSIVSHLVEECGEVCAAAGKMLRWGPASTDPTIPPEQRERNEDWLMREVRDLEEVIVRLRYCMTHTTSNARINEWGGPKP